MEKLTKQQRVDFIREIITNIHDLTIIRDVIFPKFECLTDQDKLNMFASVLGLLQKYKPKEVLK